MRRLLEEDVTFGSRFDFGRVLRRRARHIDSEWLAVFGDAQFDDEVEMTQPSYSCRRGTSMILICILLISDLKSD